MTDKPLKLLNLELHVAMANDRLARVDYTEEQKAQWAEHKRKVEIEINHLNNQLNEKLLQEL